MKGREPRNRKARGESLSSLLQATKVGGRRQSEKTKRDLCAFYWAWGTNASVEEEGREWRKGKRTSLKGRVLRQFRHGEKPPNTPPPSPVTTTFREAE